MRIINPQSATLTNIEVVSFLSSNPPRRPPSAPAGVNPKHFIPSPDLRDHNTVVKEIHNYATRLSPHLLRYPGCKDLSAATPIPETEAQPITNNKNANELSPLDDALRNLITRLQPYGLTKGEVLMIVNLGVGVPGIPGAGDGEGEGEGEEEGGEQGEGDEGVEGEGDQMDVDHAPVPEGGGDVNGDGQVEGQEGHAEAEGEGEEGEEGEQNDYGALALIDTVIEEREQRLSDDNVLEILAIIKETLGAP